MTVKSVKPRHLLKCLGAVYANLVVASSPAVAEVAVGQTKFDTCLIFYQSEPMKAVAGEIVQAAIIGAPWTTLASKFKSELRQVARDRCTVSDEQLRSSEFDALAESRLRYSFYGAIHDALGGRMASPKGRPTFDSGAVTKCLFKYIQPLHKALVVATVHEKLSGNREEPAYNALSAHLRAIGERDCSLTAEQVASPEFRVTISDYVYDASFELIAPLFSVAR